MGSVRSHQSWFGNAVDWKGGLCLVGRLGYLRNHVLFSAQMGCYSFLGNKNTRYTSYPIFSSEMRISFFETRIGATTIDSVWKGVKVEC